MDSKKIVNIVNSYLKHGEYFLVEVDVRKGNVINVLVDGDNGITIAECVKISRNIESYFDRDEEDFELRVSSPGLNKPFKLLRQYKKYIDREIEITTHDDKKITGILKSCSESNIEIEIITCKKEKIAVIMDIQLDEIKDAKPVISFN
ncbi:MAG: ribosome assembly cofactor RimP [Bacteroidales bacterium]|nr:ribosome assembly cofactor RimP [Bacteroidales bacterium]